MDVGNGSWRPRASRKLPASRHWFEQAFRGERFWRGFLEALLSGSHEDDGLTAAPALLLLPRAVGICEDSPANGTSATVFRLTDCP